MHRTGMKMCDCHDYRYICCDFPPHVNVIDATVQLFGLSSDCCDILSELVPHVTSCSTGDVCVCQFSIVFAE